MLEPGSAMDELPATGAETGTDRLGCDVATKFMFVIEDGTEDTFKAPRMPHPCCCRFALMPSKIPQKPPRWARE